MFNLDDILKGYTSEQYTEASVNTLINYLAEKGLIDINDYIDYHAVNSSKTLEHIVERDNAKAKEAYEKYKQEKGYPNV